MGKWGDNMLKLEQLLYIKTIAFTAIFEFCHQEH